MKSMILMIVTFCLNIFSSPSNYSLYGLSSAINIDASFCDWSEQYSIDSLGSDDNVYYRTSTNEWNNSDLKTEIFGGWADDKVFFFVKVLLDDSLVSVKFSEIYCNAVIKNGQANLRPLKIVREQME